MTYKLFSDLHTAFIKADFKNLPAQATLKTASLRMSCWWDRSISILHSSPDDASFDD